MKARFIKDFPALYLKEIKGVVIADLHIGIEVEENLKSISKLILTSIEEKIRFLVENVRMKILIINGDLKHQIFGFERYLKRRIEKILNLVEDIDVILIKGNHDGKIEKIIERKENVRIYSKEILLDNFYITHGHSFPSPSSIKARYWIIGHLHPAIKTLESIKEVFVISKIKSSFIEEKFGKRKSPLLFILPAFNKFSGYFTLNQKVREKRYKSPLWKDEVFDKKKTEVYTLDGKFVGNYLDL